MVKKVDLNKYVCLTPFRTIEVHKESSYLCCPTWLPKVIEHNGRSIEKVWNSNESKEIRKSVFEGSYKYCDSNHCPYLSALLKGDSTDQIGPLTLRDNFKKNIENYNEETGEIAIGPGVVQFTFDTTCNYKCPSCRIDVMTASGEEIRRIKLTIDEIEMTYSKDIEVLYITGSGDPFVSVSFRNFLRNFNPEKYPSLKKIHLHTNASMWDKEMWESMPNIHPYVKGCEISIDAASKNTYENVTRINGKWENLIENLNFISTIKTIEFVRTSFVVQSGNYLEMIDFIKLIDKIFPKKGIIFFNKITNWGTFTEGEYTIRKIWDPLHPEHENFLKEFRKIRGVKNVFHNMHELLDQSKSMI
jgi:wyosine [tRNA(Phe)-imidazoG37] synthetase (radical SAM superfamily)